jgi:signal transduction histidine kinase
LLRSSHDSNADAERLVGRMVTSVKRMNRLIEQTLVLARSLVERVPLDRRKADLARVVAEIVQDAKIREQGRSFELVGPDRIDGFWDPDRLAQVVDNLIGNAIRHGDGPVRIELREFEDQVEISVHNSGPPIPASMQASLFDPYRRSGREGGLGLGLYIVDQIVSAHGGTIKVTSTIESGTIFSVLLPRVAVDSA